MIEPKVYTMKAPQRVLLLNFLQDVPHRWAGPIETFLKEHLTPLGEVLPPEANGRMKEANEELEREIAEMGEKMRTGKKFVEAPQGE